jgi:hypothetical protein
MGSSSNAWLLLVPPIASDGSADTSQPLYKWQDAGDFETQTDCNALLQRQQFGVSSGIGRLASEGGSGSPSSQAVQLLKAQCVARDDPRLVGQPHPSI